MNTNNSSDFTDGSEFRIVQVQTSVEMDRRIVDVVCLEFANYLMIFATSEAKIGTLIEASPDDIVDFGTPTTYSTTVVFGRDELSLHLLARRLVEVVQRRILLAVSDPNLPTEMIRLIEAKIRSQNISVPRSSLGESDVGSVCTQMAPLSLSDIVVEKIL